MCERFLPIVVVCLLAFTLSFRGQEHRYAAGASAFQQENFQKAIDIFKKLVRSDPADHLAWYYLGTSYLRKEKAKDALKAFNRSIRISPSTADYRAGLAYAYLMMRNNFEASSAAMIALKLDPDQSNAYYVLSVLSLRSGSFGIAYERAKRAIEIDPTFAVAYKVKSDALVGSFSKQASTVILSPEDRYKMLEEAADDLESYIRLSPARKNPNEATEYLESIKFFAEYYRQPENLHPTPLLIERTDDLNETPLRILTRPRATYTNSARNAGVQGTVLLRVAFMASGKIRHIMVVKPLEASLDRQAILAAQRITFEPAKKNGVPISVVKQVEYSFTIF